MNHAAAIDEASDDPLRSFRNWLDACSNLRLAEVCGADYSDLVRLSADVIRTRNALTLYRVRAGWNVPDDVMRHLTVDERLLRENDDAERWPAAYANLGKPSAA